MDRKMLFDHLAKAEEHVAKGQSIVARQQALIAELERDGHDTAMARRVLREFEGIQCEHIAERDRVRAELDSLL